MLPPRPKGQGLRKPKTMTKIKLKYNLTELHKPVEQRGSYLTVSATDENGKTVEIVSNRNGWGEFKRTKGGYLQVQGTTQFSLPVSDSGVRSLLRRRYFEQLDADAQLEQMDDAHTLPRDEASR